MFFKYNKWDYDIMYPKKDGSWRIIKAGKWYINQNTPCGEPAELWERKAYDGRKRLDINKYMKIRNGGVKCSCGMEWKVDYNDKCPRCGQTNKNVLTNNLD